MTDYREYRDQDIVMKVPEYLHARSGIRTFRRARKSGDLDIMAVFFEEDQTAEALKHNITTLKAVDWPDNNVRTIHAGDSPYIAGGTDVLISHRNPITGIDLFDYELVLAQKARHVHVRIGGRGDLNAFAAQVKKIVTSIHVKDSVQKSAHDKSAKRAVGSGESDARSGCWLVSDGGPHLLLPHWLARQWKGVQDLGDAIDPNSDYGRACRADTPIGMISVGRGEALVLAGSPAMSGWGRSRDNAEIEVYILEQMYTPEPETLVDAATADVDHHKMQDTGLRLLVRRSGLLLMFAGDVPGKSAYGELKIPAQPGIYPILEHLYDGDEGRLLTLRLARPLD